MTNAEGLEIDGVWPLSLPPSSCFLESNYYHPASATDEDAANPSAGAPWSFVHIDSSGDAHDDDDHCSSSRPAESTPLSPTFPSRLQSLPWEEAAGIVGLKLFLSDDNDDLDNLSQRQVFQCLACLLCWLPFEGVGCYYGLKNDNSDGSTSSSCCRKKTSIRRIAHDSSLTNAVHPLLNTRLLELSTRIVVVPKGNPLLAREGHLQTHFDECLKTTEPERFSRQFGFATGALSNVGLIRFFFEKVENVVGGKEKERNINFHGLLSGFIQGSILSDNHTSLQLLFRNPPKCLVDEIRTWFGRKMIDRRVAPEMQRLEASSLIFQTKSFLKKEVLDISYENIEHPYSLATRLLSYSTSTVRGKGGNLDSSKVKRQQEEEEELLEVRSLQELPATTTYIPFSAFKSKVLTQLLCWVLNGKRFSFSDLLPIFAIGGRVFLVSSLSRALVHATTPGQIISLPQPFVSNSLEGSQKQRRATLSRTELLFLELESDYEDLQAEVSEETLRSILEQAFCTLRGGPSRPQRTNDDDKGDADKNLGGYMETVQISSNGLKRLPGSFRADSWMMRTFSAPMNRLDVALLIHALELIQQQKQTGGAGGSTKEGSPVFGQYSSSTHSLYRMSDSWLRIAFALLTSGQDEVMVPGQIEYTPLSDELCARRGLECLNEALECEYEEDRFGHHANNNQMVGQTFLSSSARRTERLAPSALDSKLSAAWLVLGCLVPRGGSVVLTNELQKALTQAEAAATRVGSVPPSAVDPGQQKRLNPVECCLRGILHGPSNVFFNPVSAWLALGRAVARCYHPYEIEAASCTSLPNPIRIYFSMYLPGLSKQAVKEVHDERDDDYKITESICYEVAHRLDLHEFTLQLEHNFSRWRLRVEEQLSSSS